MAAKATHVYALNERADLTLTSAGHEFLVAEEQEARRAWITALLAIPAKFGPRRTAAVNKALRLRERYELLIGHKAGSPDQEKQQRYIDDNEPF